MSVAVICSGTWRLLCVRLWKLALCQRLRINHLLSLVLSAPEEAYSRNVRASGTLKFGYEGVFSEYFYFCMKTLSTELLLIQMKRKRTVIFNFLSIVTFN